MKVEVEEYNSDWAAWYEDLKSRIWPAVSDFASSIEHVGSTSVKGLSAKPRIDIDVIADAPELVENCICALESIGYKHRGDLGVPGRQAFRANQPKYPHNLYVCLNECDSLKNHLILRDHLRVNRSDRDRYSKIKMELAKKYPNDIDSYVDGKTDFIVSILKQYDFNLESLESIEEVNRKT